MTATTPGPSVGEFAAWHTSPWFDLATEPWVPVLQAGGSVTTLGLGPLLFQAHKLVDIAEPDALGRASLRRFLEGVTARLVQLSGADNDTWWELLKEDAGFPASAVQALLADQADHLWLYHPATPFLQERRLLKRKPKIVPAANLLIRTPAETSPAWFVKPTEPQVHLPLPPDRAAVALTRAWFYTLNGNSGKNALDGANCGSVFGEGLAGVSHAFRVSGRSLFHSLLRNLTPDHVAPHPGQPAKLVGPAWVDPDRPRSSPSGLYSSTLTTTSALLGPRTGEAVAHVALGPAPDARGTAKQLKDEAASRDPHRLTAQKPAKDGTLKTRVVRCKVGEHRLHTLNRLHQEALGGDSTLMGVAREASLWLTPCPSGRESLELVLTTAAGTGSSPVWTDTALIEVPTEYLTEGSPEQAYLQSVLAACFHSQRGMDRALRRSCALALSRPDPSGTRWEFPDRADVEPLVRTVVDAWLDQADRIVVDALDVVSDEVDSVVDYSVAALGNAARQAFAEATAPYRSSPRYATSVAHAQSYLSRALKGTMS